MGRQGEGGGLRILKNEETSFMDDPYPEIQALSLVEKTTTKINF